VPGHEEKLGDVKKPKRSILGQVCASMIIVLLNSDTEGEEVGPPNPKVLKGNRKNQGAKTSRGLDQPPSGFLPTC